LVHKLYLILTVIIIAVVAVAGFVVCSGVLNEKPSFLVTSQTLSGKTGDTITLNIQISNIGGDAKGVVLTASSPAFNEAVSSKFDAPAHTTVNASCQITVNDVESKDYPITLTYTADGNIFGGSSGNVASNAVFHAIPNLEITNINWQNDVVGNGDFTYLYFTIKSNTDFAAENIDFKLTLQPTVANLAVSPSSGQVGIINPKTSTEPIHIAVASYSAQAGAHPLQIKLLQGDYEIATAMTTVNVAG
jgi:hypothetical protein